MLKTCPSQGSKSIHAITRSVNARSVAIWPIGTTPSLVNSTTSETSKPIVPVICWSHIHNIVAVNAADILTLISAIWRIIIVNIPAVWFNLRFAMLLKTAWAIGRPRGIYGVTIGYLFHGRPYRTGWKQRGKKTEVEVKGEYIDEALSEFSGYIAADELYDGPFCVLFIVDNRKFNRLYYEVLDHNPTHEDMTAFFKRFKAMLDARDLMLHGVTTDGSPLYPEPIADVFGEIQHQQCRFHVIKEINKDILKAVTQVRKQLKVQKLKCSRGRPSGKKARRIARKNKQLQKKIAALFEHRHLFVKHTLTASEKKILQRITRGLPQLRVLRTIMNEVYRLFDRRCCMDTALDKLKRLRRRIKRFLSLGETLKKLFSPNLEKSLIFLDDSLLPATSNAVERANRRHRKMQKSVYRVRTRDHISQRIAIDMLRDAYACGRNETVNVLHHTRKRGLLCR